MPKALAIFNVIAGSASIAGFYFTLVTQYQSPVLLALFGIKAIFCSYVLFVPDNPIEANVGNKLTHYHATPKGATISIQQDDFDLYGTEKKDIQFQHPFASQPEVELINHGGETEICAEVTSVTSHQFKVVNTGRHYLNQNATYRWIAKGVLLVPSNSPRG